MPASQGFTAQVTRSEFADALGLAPQSLLPSVPRTAEPAPRLTPPTACALGVSGTPSLCSSSMSVSDADYKLRLPLPEHYPRYRQRHTSAFDGTRHHSNLETIAGLYRLSGATDGAFCARRSKCAASRSSPLKTSSVRTVRQYAETAIARLHRCLKFGAGKAQFRVPLLSPRQSAAFNDLCQGRRVRRRAGPADSSGTLTTLLFQFAGAGSLDGHVRRSWLVILDLGRRRARELVMDRAMQFLVDTHAWSKRLASAAHRRYAPVKAAAICRSSLSAVSRKRAAACPSKSWRRWRKVSPA